jgi:hypothetical protein
MMLSVGGRMVNSLNTVGHGPDDKTDILGANFSHEAGSKMRQSCASRWCRTTGSCTSDESYYSASRPPGQRHSQVQRLGAGVHTSACVSARNGLQQCSWPQGLRPITVQFHNSNSSNVDYTPSYGSLVSKSKSENFGINVVCMDIFTPAYATSSSGVKH